MTECSESMKSERCAGTYRLSTVKNTAAMNDRPNINTKEYNWFLDHIEIEDQYAGEYIAIVDDGVVAHGKNFNAVREEAKKHGEDPLLHKVPAPGKDQVV